MNQKNKFHKSVHQYSIEQLYHFRCGKCNRWWSIGDFNQHSVKLVCCPWCGESGAISPMENKST